MSQNYGYANAVAAKQAELELRKAANNIEYCNTALSEIFEEMQANGWKGNSSTKFYQNYETYQSEMGDLKDQVNSALALAAKAIQEAEAQKAELEQPM